MKQQEIKDEINKLIDRCYTERSPGDGGLMVFRRQKFLNELLPLLDRLGVVIRVDRERPEPCMEFSFEQIQGYIFCQEDMAGYVAVESLIEEGE